MTWEIERRLAANNQSIRVVCAGFAFTNSLFLLLVRYFSGVVGDLRGYPNYALSSVERIEISDKFRKNRNHL